MRGEVPVPDFLEADEVEVMSNFDLAVCEGAADALRAGKWGRHAAWAFNGKVWYSPGDGLFYEQVWRYHAPVAVYGAASLPALMHLVNETWGSE